MAEEADATPGSTSESSELASGLDVGGYVVDKKIGEGGMGVVYGANHPRIGKRVAIKVLSPAFCGDPGTVQRFEQEARLVNEIKHPNIVDVFQFGELPDGRSYFVMEWLEGESLSAVIDRGPMSAREAMDVLDPMCDALEAAHEKGVIHRDLKSDNVFIVAYRKQKRVKLLDFGLAKLAKAEPNSKRHTTKEGIVVGTPAYMSPEQARGQTVDGRTDIYALGCLAYKMVTARLPFQADNAMDLIIKQMNDAPPSPAKYAPKLPAPLSKMIVKMMAKDAAERPTLAQVRELIAELRQAPAQPAKRSGRAVSILIGVLLFLCGVITLGVIGILKNRDEHPAAAAAPGSGSAPVAPGSGSAPAPPSDPGSAALPAPTIEFGDDNMAHSPRPGAGSASPAAGSGTQPALIANVATVSGTTGAMGSAGATTGSAAPAVATGSAAATGSASPAVGSAGAKPPVGVIMLMLDTSSQIELDGRVLSQDSKGGKFEVLPGSHTLRVKAAGRQPVTRTVEVEAGATAVLHIVDDTPAAAAKIDAGVADPSTDKTTPPE